jgi:hypothetical protein
LPMKNSNIKQIYHADVVSLFSFLHIAIICFKSW